MESLLTVTQAAERLDLHRTRIHAMIRAGKLPAMRTGSILLIREEDLALVVDRKPGRPKKTGGEGETAELPAVTAEMKAGDTVKTKGKRAKKGASKKARKL